jgi:hypothetical protein
VYAGCVYWPFHGHTTIGTILVAVIIGGGLIDTTVKLVRGDKKARELESSTTS